MEQIWSFFAFPLNLLLASLWMTGWAWLWKKRRESFAVRFLLSPAATVNSFVLLLSACLWIGITGKRVFVQSALVVVVLLYVQTVVFMVTLRGWKRADGSVRWRFLLIHAGFLLAVGAGFWGSPDSSEYRLQLHRGQQAREAYRLDGHMTAFRYEIELDDFTTEYSQEGKPVHYEALISIDGNPPVKVSVNHPHNVRFGENIYLTGISDSGCVFMIVREPWRYFALAGIIMLLAGAFMLFIKGPRR